MECPGRGRTGAILLVVGLERHKGKGEPGFDGKEVSWVWRAGKQQPWDVCGGVPASASTP